MSASEKLRALDFNDSRDIGEYMRARNAIADVVEAAEERQRLLSKLSMPEPSRYVTPTEFDLNGQRMRQALTALREHLEGQ